MGINSESKHLKDERFSCPLKEKVKFFVENSLRKNVISEYFPEKRIFQEFQQFPIGFVKNKYEFLSKILKNHSFLSKIFDSKHFPQRIFDENFYFFFQMTGKTFIFQMLRFRIDSHNSSRRNFTIISLRTPKPRIRQKSMKYESSFVKSHSSLFGIFVTRVSILLTTI